MQWSLYSGNKNPGTSFKWSLVALYRLPLYREKFDLKTYGRTTAWSLRTGGCFKKVVVQIGLTVNQLWFSCNENFTYLRSFLEGKFYQKLISLLILLIYKTIGKWNYVVFDPRPEWLCSKRSKKFAWGKVFNSVNG